MRHRLAHRKLGRVSAHRVAMLRNQAEALLRYERLQTTVPRAKELRPFVERLITLAKRGIASGDGPRVLHARRLVLRDIADRTVVSKLFETIAPRFTARSGGYTRLLRIGFRRGDSAEMAQVELVGSEYQPKVEAPPGEKERAAPPKAKGVGGRLKAAAQRIRGRKGTEPDEKETETPRGGARATPKPSKKSPARSRRKTG